MSNTRQWNSISSEATHCEVSRRDLFEEEIASQFEGNVHCISLLTFGFGYHRAMFFVAFRWIVRRFAILFLHIALQIQSNPSIDHAFSRPSIDFLIAEGIDGIDSLRENSLHCQPFVQRCPQLLLPS